MRLNNRFSPNICIQTTPQDLETNFSLNLSRIVAESIQQSIQIFIIYIIIITFESAFVFDIRYRIHLDIDPT